MVSSGGEAAVVLVEGEVEKRGRRGGWRKRLGRGRKWGVENRVSGGSGVPIRSRGRVMLNLRERILAVVGLVSRGKEIRVRVRVRSRIS